ncbi:MAG: hypothetical protein FJW26_09815 [Acidimicrobiia bacterium]|nr:hypothetical protein [Acidimicrobiia bacterium]
MNCDEFESCLVDLAGPQGVGSAARTEALRHAIACPRCAARLADERALLAGLKALADGTRNDAAPARVESGLLGRFHELVPMKAATPAPLVGVASSSGLSWKTAAQLGLAASALLVLGWTLVRSNREAAVVDQPPISRSAESFEPPQQKVQKEGASRAEIVPFSLAPHETRRALRTPSTRRSARGSEARARSAARPASPSEGLGHRAVSAFERQTETPFLPFMAARPPLPSEQRQFVRIRLPRSALHVFGLPMNMERAAEPVHADVMLGEDGRALAVRFVND